MAELDGKVALVTGGSKGIGAATAQVLAAAGARLIITHRDSAAEAEQVLAGLPGTGHRAMRASVDDTAAVNAMAQSVREIEGRLDILVNNAGRTKPIPHADLDALDDEFFDMMMATNVRGVFACIRACRDLLQASRGLVVNISSVAGLRAKGSNVGYCASKAAVNNMTVSLARALAPEIRVNAIAPGLIETPMAKMWSPEQKVAMVQNAALKRVGQPEEIGRTVLALATHLTFTTGDIIVCDGGAAIT